MKASKCERYQHVSHHVCPAGAKAKALICKARADVASMVGGRAEDIIFTSGGTEVRH